MSRFPNGGRPGGYQGGQGRPRDTSIACLFDPSKDDSELFDKLAEDQAEEIPPGLKSNQLRRYFTELKGLLNQLRSLTAADPTDENKEKLFLQKINPRFRMLRSKIAYGSRQNGSAQLQPQFAEVLEQGIKKVQDAKQFERFVLHIEAVVGFLYGKDKVSKQ